MRSVAIPVKLCALLCALVSMFAMESMLLRAAFALLTFAFLLAQGNRRLVFSYGSFYLLLSALLYLIRFRGLRMVVFSEFHVLMFWNLSPVFLLAWDLMTTPAGELSAFLSKLRAPSTMILGLLVVFRFFPTMESEFKGVMQSMRNRRLTRVSQVLRHPLLTFEYVLVPLLLRCLQLADQLSVSAVARGAEAPGIRGSYYGKPVARRDWVWVIGWALASVSFLVIGGVK